MRNKLLCNVIGTPVVQGHSEGIVSFFLFDLDLSIYLMKSRILSFKKCQVSCFLT